MSDEYMQSNATVGERERWSKIKIKERQRREEKWKTYELKILPTSGSGQYLSSIFNRTKII